MLSLRPSSSPLTVAPSRSSPVRHRARLPAAAPSACAECVRKSLKQQKEQKPARSRRRQGEAAPLLIAFAAKPGFDDDDEEETPPTSSSPSSPSPADPGDTLPEDGPALSAALALLRFYRNSLSPLMPKSCRFLPTCSEFAQISYRKFGVVKGTVLTAWRLLRCNPLNPGRTFYDPPRWPPVGLEWAFGEGGGGGGEKEEEEEEEEERKK